MAHEREVVWKKVYLVWCDGDPEDKTVIEDAPDSTTAAEEFLEARDLHEDYDIDDSPAVWVAEAEQWAGTGVPPEVKQTGPACCYNVHRTADVSYCAYLKSGV